MADTPLQPDWPLRFTTLPDGTVQLAEIEQGTDPARAADAAIVLCTPKGWRDDQPDFGVSSLPFQQGPIDTARLAAELAQSDPALAGITADETLDLAHATVRTVTVDTGKVL